MPQYPDIYVLRHGQTEWNAVGRHQGRKDSALTTLGRRQAAAQGRILAALNIDPGATRFYSSPQGRAWRTARIALAAINQQPVADARLREVSFGQWEGLTAPEIDTRWPDNRAVQDMFEWHFTAPGGENFEAMQDRVTSFLDDLTGPAVVICHGITSRVLRGVWRGLDRSDMGDIGGGQGVVYRLNCGAQTCLEPPI